MLLLVWFLPELLAERVYALHEYQITKYYRFENLNEEEIVQQFTPKYSKLDSIELFLANINEETEGNVCLEITDDTGKKIFEKKYNISQIPTGEFYTYEIGKRIKSGKTYELKICYDGKAEEIPQIMISERNKNLVETGSMYVSGEASLDYNLAVSYRYR